MGKSICAGYSFNSGVSPCPLDPGKIKAILLATDKGAFGHDLSHPMTTSDGLVSRFYAARPDRIYPIGGIVNYESSGGEAQTSQVGYGATRVTGYSEKQMTFTLDGYDFNLRSMIAENIGKKFYVLFVDDENRVYGYPADPTDYELGLVGIPVTLSVGGQDFATASDAANLTVTLYINDYEKMLKELHFAQVDYDVEEVANGLVFVDVVFDGTLGAGDTSVTFTEHFSGANISAYVSQMLTTTNALTVLKHTGSSTVTYVSYDATHDYIVLSHSDTNNTYTGLQDAVTLYGAGVYGIEEW